MFETMDLHSRFAIYTKQNLYYGRKESIIFYFMHLPRSYNLSGYLWFIKVSNTHYSIIKGCWNIDQKSSGPSFTKNKTSRGIGGLIYCIFLFSSSIIYFLLSFFQCGREACVLTTNIWGNSICIIFFVLCKLVGLITCWLHQADHFKITFGTLLIRLPGDDVVSSLNIWNYTIC